MDNTQFENYKDISPEKFEFATDVDLKHDVKFDTKPVSYMRDALRRFSKNKGSVVAACIILLLVLYAIIGPYCCDAGFQKAYETDNLLVYYKQLPPRIKAFEGSGFWDGSEKREVSENRLHILQAMAIETGHNPIQKVLGESVTDDVFSVTKHYEVRVDAYYACPTFTLTLTYDEYLDIQKWQDEHNIQVILPRVNEELAKMYNIDKSVWFVCNQKGKPELDVNGNYKPGYFTSGYDDYTSSMRLASDPGAENPEASNRYRYAQRTGTADRGYNYVIRVGAYNYFQYRYGFEPGFVFGSDTRGFDIFSRLAKGARFSLLLALLVSIVNLTIGAIYGAIEGYYGGIVDMTMERISDILNDIPFMVVTILFQLHLAAKVGVVGSLIFAFFITGWIGMASRVRMQFYRFKNQEYVLAARTLGAKDSRIIWKHIFPNSLGTIITGSVLVIPGVIFSETSLSYLGIINLDSATMSSVGAMLSTGQAVMTTSPHVVLFPALFIALLMISFNLFGNGLRDAFNPSLRGSEG